MPRLGGHGVRDAGRVLERAGRIQTAAAAYHPLSP
jgi:hypothetical protein